MSILEKIDKETYKLNENNYINQGTVKKRIVIGNTFSTDMRHCIGWNKRWNGKYTRTAMFTIDMKGNVFQHFSPNFYSNFLDNPDINESTISILLENEGWLIKDLNDENKYITYVGHIYNRKDSVVEKRWRNHKFWAPYSEEQKESLYKLTKELCIEFNIPLKVIAHNTNFDTVSEYEGVLYRSNFEKYYTDVSPAWDCVEMKNKIEIKI
jgi:hypothetical protein